MSPSNPAKESANLIGSPPFVWIDVVFPDPALSPRLRRADWLTPYAAETIAEDALRGGRGARLEITVPRGTSVAAIAAARNWFSNLPDRGIEVRVRLADDVSATGITMEPGYEDLSAVL
jgi:hypothetical protein